MEGKRGQIWVETMIYTLIAFALIALVLTFAIPKIEQIRDKGIIEQSIRVLEDVDSVISDLQVPGNQRVLELGLSKGILKIDGANDKVVFEIESSFEYSQPGEDVNVGEIVANTAGEGKLKDVTLTLDYSGRYNIAYQTADELKEITKASTPYKILISNIGEDESGLTIINFELGN